MTLDTETNFIYFSSLFPLKYEKIYQALVWHFERNNINHGLLNSTKDIWAVDYMPIQLNNYSFIQFKFKPKYLEGTKYDAIRTDGIEVCGANGILPRYSNVIMDGGNIVKGKKKAIMTTRIFEDNFRRGEDDILKYLEEELQVGQIVFIPQEPGDLFGHSDGVVRFIDDDHVIINEYPSNIKIYREYGLNLRACLRNANLNFLEIPYNGWRNKGKDATGCYMNFLEVGEFIFIPVFGVFDDMVAFNRIRNLFPNRRIIDIDCSDLAKEGGLLNCISWNCKIKN